MSTNPLLPNADIWDWQLSAACRGQDSAMFFHPEGERGFARTARIRRAKQICQSCPVLAQCRSHALEVGEPFGIWGGLSEVELSNAQRQRRNWVDQQ
ncbi:WhiB family transcriptional regulator [Nocardia iowensis]|uniref:Transcriptional regulator WhiB n=1 Tax=Nocardia iowensis TaxID=204891 RepID=A0ABX8S487_NOCIO|nr:WhiB family transcriptional regulator [Nocardia iowensis]QXN94696.1 WhiB family transcriptional regulator [Nocardia iowensis]